MPRPFRRAHTSNASVKLKARSQFLDTFLLYQLSIASAYSDRLLTRLLDTELKLSLAEWRVILMVGEVPNLSTDALAARTTMEKARVSRAIARLVALGLLDRKVQDSDRRLIALSLTTQGRAVFKSSLTIGKSAENQILNPISKQERAQLFHILTKLSTYKPALDLVQSR